MEVRRRTAHMRILIDIQSTRFSSAFLLRHLFLTTVAAPGQRETKNRRQNWVSVDPHIALQQMVLTLPGKPNDRELAIFASWKH